MAAIIVNNVDDLVSVVGYSVVGSAPVVGTAVAGDRVVFADSFRGYHTMPPNIGTLYLNPGVWIDGPGSEKITLNCKLYCKGTGGTQVVTRVNGLTFDLSFLPAMELDGVGFIASGMFRMRNTSCYVEDVVVRNQNPLIGVSANNVSVISNQTLPSVVCVFLKCDFSMASRACFNNQLFTDGPGSGTSTAYLLDCTASMPGVGKISTGLTGISTIENTSPSSKVIVDGGNYFGTTWQQYSSYVFSAPAPSAFSTMSVYNAGVFNKGISNVGIINGCFIDVNGSTSASTVILTSATEIKHTRIQGMQNNESFSAIMLENDVANLEIDYLDVVGAGTGYAIVSDVGSFAHDIKVSNVICSNVRFGIYAPNTVTSGSYIQDCLLSCMGATGTQTPFSIRSQTTGITSNNIVDQPFYGNAPMGVGDVQRTITAQELEAKRGNVLLRRYPVPFDRNQIIENLIGPEKPLTTRAFRVFGQGVTL